MARLPSYDPISFLVGQKYNLASGSGSGFSQSTPTAEQRAANEEHWKRLQKAAEDFRKELEQKDEIEIAEMVEEIRAADRVRQLEAKERAEEAHSFNQPNALATPEKYTYWCKARYWNISEATALLIGRDPKCLSEEKVKNDRKGSKIGTDYLQSRELVERAFRQICNRRHVAPSDYVQWALNIGMPVPQDLLDAFDARGPQIKEWSEEQAELQNKIAQLREQVSQLEQEAGARSADPSPKSLSVRERESLLKLVIGMAIGGYAYDPKASRTATAREICSDLQLRGLTLDEDTIRKYLNEAREQLQGGVYD